PEIGGKWLELLKQAAPTVARVGIVLDPENSSHAALRRAAEAAAPALSMQVTALGVHDASEIARGISGFAKQQNSGLIVLSNPVPIRNRDLIIGACGTLPASCHLYVSLFRIWGRPDRLWD